MTTCQGNGSVEQLAVIPRGNTAQGFELKVCNRMHKQFKFVWDQENTSYFSDPCKKYDDNIYFDHSIYKGQRINLIPQGFIRNKNSLFNQDQLIKNSKTGSPNGSHLITKHLNYDIKTTSQAHPDIGKHLSEIRKGIIL